MGVIDHTDGAGVIHVGEALGLRMTTSSTVITIPTVCVDSSGILLGFWYLVLKVCYFRFNLKALTSVSNAIEN